MVTFCYLKCPLLIFYQQTTTVCRLTSSLFFVEDVIRPISLPRFIRRTHLKKIFISIITVLVVITALFTRPALAADAAHGQQLFGTNCASCHAGGKNLVNPAKTLGLSDLEHYQMDSLEAITTQITKGKNAMPAFTGRLKPSDIEDIASYVLAQAQKGW